MELNDINKLLNTGDQVIGTGIERLDQGKLENMVILDESNISASNLIHLFNSEAKKDYFEKTTAEKLESRYLSSSQVNNTKV